MARLQSYDSGMSTLEAAGNLPGAPANVAALWTTTGHAMQHAKATEPKHSLTTPPPLPLSNTKDPPPASSSWPEGTALQQHTAPDTLLDTAVSPGPSTYGAAAPVDATARRGKRSRFNGVSWIESERKWVARFWDTERKEQRTLGRFAEDDEAEAAMAVDRAVLEQRQGVVQPHQLNFPNLLGHPDQQPAMPAGAAGPQHASIPPLPQDAPVARPSSAAAQKPRKRAPAATSSGYKGVSWIDNSKKWRAQIWSDNKVVFIGYYHTEEAAAQAFDKAVLLLGEDKETNFPPESYTTIDDDPNVTKLRPRHHTAAARARGDEAARPPRPGPPPKRRRNASSGPSSRYKGVSWSERSRKWRAQLWHDGKVQHLGFFDCEEDAARCYDRECLRKKGRDAQVNFPRPPDASDSEDEVPEVHRDEWGGAGGLTRSGHNLCDVLEPDGRPYRLRDRQNVRRVVDEDDSQGEFEEELDEMELWARSCVYVSPARARLLLSLDDGPPTRHPPPPLLWGATRPRVPPVREDDEGWQRLSAALQHLQRCE